MEKVKNKRVLASLPTLAVGMKGFPIKDLFLPNFDAIRLGANSEIVVDTKIEPSLRC